MELSTAELYLVLRSLKFYCNISNICYPFNEDFELISKIQFHLDNLNK